MSRINKLCRLVFSLVVVLTTGSVNAKSASSMKTKKGSARDLAHFPVTDDPSSLLEAVQLLLREVSELKEENLYLRKGVKEAQSHIESLQDVNEALLSVTKSIQSQQQSSSSSSSSYSSYWKSSTKLRGNERNGSTAKETQALIDRLDALEDKMACVSSNSNEDDLFLDGCNVHIRDGSGQTEGNPFQQKGKPGRGNLFIGYNELPDRSEAPEVCSKASALDSTSCRRAGGVWGQGLQTGIHNLIVGGGHSFTQHSGLVVGKNNAIVGVGASVTGGHSNVASGAFATIAGGAENVATGKSSVVVGGYDNEAAGTDSFVGGGSYNEASGSVATIVGGGNNIARGDVSFVSGGSMNEVSGEYSCSTGSFSSSASGKETAIAAGRSVVAAVDESIIAGGGFGMPMI